MAVVDVSRSVLTQNSFLQKPKLVEQRDLMDAVIRQIKEISRVSAAFENNSDKDSDKQYTGGVQRAAESCLNSLTVASSLFPNS